MHSATTVYLVIRWSKIILFIAFLSSTISHLDQFGISNFTKIVFLTEEINIFVLLTTLLVVVKKPWQLFCQVTKQVRCILVSISQPTVWGKVQYCSVRPSRYHVSFRSVQISHRDSFHVKNYKNSFFRNKIWNLIIIMSTLENVTRWNVAWKKLATVLTNSRCLINFYFHRSRLDNKDSRSKITNVPSTSLTYIMMSADVCLAAPVHCPCLFKKCALSWVNAFVPLVICHNIAM